MNRRTKSPQWFRELSHVVSLAVDWMSMTRGEKLRMAGLVASLAAGLALWGDSLLLGVERDLSALVKGHLLGTLAIPAYALGYWQVSSSIRRASPRLALWMLLSGGFASGVGAAIHAATAVALQAGGMGPTPGEFGPYAALLEPLWCAAAAAVLVASAAYVLALVGAPTPLSRIWAVLSPASIIGLLLLLGLLPWAPRWLAPVSPNLGHLIFFLVMTNIVWRSRPA